MSTGQDREHDVRPEESPEAGLTHVDEHGRARMVDVTGKTVTSRRALARCVVRARVEAIKGLADDEDVLPFARAAGIQAAKRTARLIPLCHPLPVDAVRVRIVPGDGVVEIAAIAEVEGRTGIEIEAMTACAVAGLSVLMAVLPADPSARLDDVALWEKAGGRSGTWRRPGSISPDPGAGDRAPTD